MCVINYDNDYIKSNVYVRVLIKTSSDFLRGFLDSKK